MERVEFGCEVQCLAGQHTLRIYPGEDFYDEIAERGSLTYCRPCQQKQCCSECGNDDCLICDGCPPELVFKTIMCVNCLKQKKDYDPEYWYCVNCQQAQLVEEKKQKRAMRNKERRVGRLFLEKLRLERDVQRDRQLDTYSWMQSLDASVVNRNFDQTLQHTRYLLDWAQKLKADTRPAEIEALQQELDAECTHI